ncbi:hypothetical protein FXN63_16565 [Pigmentiphaga aceris]|uniref:Uncharacterized protein n=1 Tax=Pigmentiphaga aceris TaxID=1940612 RepID=A0A5C0AXT9_9BURK|nr:hypothetical protein [Pigmentiphaga aceris]QEI07279.1 hypothetical protein FXN63_16565 [Pigmentiphaga aceris]
MVTIYIDRAETDESIARVRAEIGPQAEYHLGWKLGDVDVQRDDHTWVDGDDTADRAALLALVQKLLSDPVSTPP